MSDARARIVGGAAVLLVRDVAAAAEYYRDRLGFRYDRLWGEPPCFCIVWRDGNHLMLREAAEVTMSRSA